MVLQCRKQRQLSGKIGKVLGLSESTSGDCLDYKSDPEDAVKCRTALKVLQSCSTPQPSQKKGWAPAHLLSGVISLGNAGERQV